MFVEFIANDDNMCLAIKGTEFIKAEKNVEEFGSLLMSIDAFAALHNGNLKLTRKEYDAIKSWLDKNGIVIVKFKKGRTVKTWIEINVQNGAHSHRAVYCYDKNGNDIESIVNPDKKPSQ